MLPRTGLTAALLRSGAAAGGCAQCGGLGLRRRVAGGEASSTVMMAAAAAAGAAAGGGARRALSTPAKKKEKKKGAGAGEEGGGDASKNAWYIKLLDEPEGAGSKALPADLQAKYQAIGRRYNIESQKRHAREMGDLHRKIKLKTEAMNALPTPELRAEAATIDPTPFPPTRRLTTWTPPVPGFEAGKYDLPGAI